MSHESAPGTGTLTVEEFGLGDPRLREFVALSWRLYRGDPHWTPPLDADYLGNKLLGTVGLLTAEHPYHLNADVTHFLARRDGRVVGRVSAAENRRFNDHYGSRIGFFGFFECENDFEAASALLDAARDWILARGMTAMRGPGEYSNATHERQGVLVHGFDSDPTVECTHNPPYYDELLQRWGLSKVMDYHAYTVDIADTPEERLHRLANAARKRASVAIETRTAVLKNLDEELTHVIHIYNEAWAKNWGFLPLTDAEAAAVADTLRPIIDPGLVRFALVDGEPVAVLGAFPDPNWALKPKWGPLGDSDPVRIARLLATRRNIPRVRLMFFGVKPGYRIRGLDAILFEEAYEYSKAHGYTSVEASLLLEVNDLIIRASEAFGGKLTKTWRIYERAL